MANQHTSVMSRLPEEVAERRLFVLDCRRKAQTWDQVADSVAKHFGYRVTPTQCAEDFRVLMRVRNAELREEIDDTRQVMVDQLDKLLVAHMDKATHDVASAEVVLKILTRKARLLGADAPVKTEIDDKRTIASIDPEQILFRIDQLRNKIARKRGEVPAVQVIDVTPTLSNASPSSPVLLCVEPEPGHEQRPDQHEHEGQDGTH